MQGVLVGVVLASLAAGAAVFQNRPRADSNWELEEAVRLLQESPWVRQARPQTLGAAEGTRGRVSESAGGTVWGVSGEAPGRSEAVYTVRLLSARPVREAYQRLYRVLNRAPGPSAPLGAGPAEAPRQEEEIVVALQVHSPGRAERAPLQQIFQHHDLKIIEQGAFLETESTGRVGLQGYYPPTSEGTGALFIFPQAHQGRPLVTARDRWLRFVLAVPDTDHTVTVLWELLRLAYNGVWEF